MNNLRNFVNQMSFLSKETREALIDGAVIGLRQSRPSTDAKQVYEIEDQLQGCREVTKTIKDLHGKEHSLTYHESRGGNRAIDGKPALVVNNAAAKEIDQKYDQIVHFARNFANQNPSFTIADADPTADGGFYGQQGLTDYETTEFASYILRQWLPDISDINDIPRMNFVVGTRITTSIYFTQLQVYANYAYNNWSSNFPAIVNSSSSLMVAKTCCIKTGVRYSAIQEERAAVRKYSKIGVEKEFAVDYLQRIEYSAMYAGMAEINGDGSETYFTHGIGNAKGLLPALTALNGTTTNTVEDQTYDSMIQNVARLIDKVVNRLNLLYNIAIDGLKVGAVKGNIRIYMANEIMEKANRLFNPTTQTITALQQLQKIYPGVIFTSSLYLSENYVDSTNQKDYIWLEQNSRMLIIIEPAALKRFIYANVKNFTEQWSRLGNQDMWKGYTQEYAKGIGDILLGTPACVQFLDFGTSTQTQTERPDLYLA